MACRYLLQYGNAAMLDVHNHLHDPRLEAWLEAILDNMESTGIRACIANGTHPDDWAALRHLSEASKLVYAAYGVHPWQAHRVEAGWDDALKTALRHPCVVGVGECGLDKWVREPSLDKQEPVFLRQLEIAAEFELPVFVHGLQCWGRMLEALRSVRLPSCGFLLHSYSGPEELVNDFLDLGAYFSFSGSFLHERKEDRRRLFSRLPLERVLAETDAPDMALPESHCRWELKAQTQNETAPNHPCNLEVVYAALAGLRQMDLLSFAQQMRENASCLLGSRFPV